MIRRTLIMATLMPLVFGAASSAAPSPPDLPAAVAWDASDPRLLQGPLMHAITRIDGAAAIVSGVQAAQDAGRQTFVFADTIHDMDGDGGRDIAVLHYSFDPTGTGPTRVKVRIHRGRNAKHLFTKRYELESGFAFPVEAKVGPKARNGLVIMVIDGVQRPFSEWEVSATAVNGRGKELWTHSHKTYIVETEVGWVAHDVPVSVETFNALPGKQTEVLMGVGEVVMAGWEPIAHIHAEVINGRDGEVLVHDHQETGVHTFPAPWAAGDQDGDRLDDYVFINNRPWLQQGSQSGIVGVGGTLEARKGTDGSALWHNYGIDLGEPTWLWVGTNMIGDRSPELMLGTQYDERPWPEGRNWDLILIHGNHGAEVWRGRGLWPYVPGDINGDGRDDIIARNLAHQWQKERVVVRMRAYSSATGKVIWKRNIATKTLKTTPGLGSGVGTGWLPVGDLQADGLEDTEVFHDMGNDSERKFVRYTVDAKTGRRLHRGGKELHPLGASLDGDGSDIVLVRRTAPDALRVTAVDGRSGRILWRRSVTVDPLGRDEDIYMYVRGGRLNRDRVPDVVLSVSRGFISSYLVVLDGRDGSTIWKRDFGD